MKLSKGDIVIANIKGIAGKPRPILILQNELLNSNLFTTLVAPITSTVELQQEIFRPVIKPSEINGINKPSQIMLDKMTVVSKIDIAQRIGCLDKKEIKIVNQTLGFIFGL